MNVERMWNDRPNPVLHGERPTTSRLSQETTRKRGHMSAEQWCDEYYQGKVEGTRRQNCVATRPTSIVT
jgi:hypothetical protein